MGKMVIAIANLPKEDLQMVVCQDTNGTVQAWHNLTEAHRDLQVNRNNPWEILSTVQLKVGVMVIPEGEAGIEFLQKLVGEHPTPLRTRGGFLHSQMGLLIPKENHVLWDDLIMVRE